MKEEQKIPVQEQFRIIADTAPVLIWIADIHKSCYFFNKGWLDFTGRTLDEEYGEGWTRGVHPDDLERCRELYIKSFDSRQRFKMEYRLLRNDGQYRWVLNTGVPRYAEDGSFAGYIGSCLDIQEKKEIEIAKDEFISIAGHELKTPLTTLMISAQMLDKLFKTDPGSHYIPELIQTSTSSLKKLEALINDLLHVGVIKDGKMHLNKTEFKFEEMIRECLNYFRLTVNKNFVVSGNTDIRLSGDPKKLEQVLMNLLNNALKYAPASEQINISIEETGHFMKVTVRDFGPGISPENLPFIFDRYYRGGKKINNHVSGFGLGLYISREIIRQHGGDMGVDSTPGEGSAFWFSLPLNDKAEG